ncbi:MAG: hypothetical protein WCS99_14330 [Limisphaerales bacterium]
MEFLKNHYEKIVLGLMLLLMATGAVVLVLQVGSAQEELDKFRNITLEGEGKGPSGVNMTNRMKALNSFTNPPQVEFVSVHKVFNPDTWYVDTNGNFVAGVNVGVRRLLVQQITSQHLKLELVSIGGSPERPSVKVSVVKEFGKTLGEQGKKSVTLSLNTTNSINTLDASRKLVLLAREIGGTPEMPEVRFELLEPGKEPVQFTMTKAKGFTIVVDHVAHIVYPVETNFVWRAARKDTPLVFAGDTNIVVEITTSNVVVKAVSNDKPTTIPLGPAQPVAPRKQP